MTNAAATGAQTMTILDQPFLGPNGWQTVGSIVCEMQAAGTRQILIDRWLQGLELGQKLRRQ